MNSNIENILKKYSFDDIARALFSINLYINNISSLIKSQYLYVCFEASQRQGLNNIDIIKTYEDFKEFYNKIIPLVPDFSIIEDYVPNTDWGDIFYNFQGNNYKIFYGNELEHVADFYKSFELMHSGNEELYLEKLGRSFSKEFIATLRLNDYIITNISQAKIKNIHPGDLYLPSRKFWLDCNNLLNNLNLEEIVGADFLAIYTYKSHNIATTNESEFIENAMNGKNCDYSFVSDGTRYYPVMPRKLFVNIYDNWGDNLDLLIKNGSISTEVVNYRLSASIGYFLKNRLPEKSFQPILSPLTKDGKIHDIAFPGVLVEGNNVYIFVNFGLFLSTNNELEKLADMLSSIRKSLLSNGLKFVSHLIKGSGIEFINNDNPYNITYIGLLPNHHTYSKNSTFHIPKRYIGEIWTFDNFIGILSEIETPEQLSKFIKYKKDLSSISIINDPLDIFGSFIDSKGVLVAGGRNPDFLVLTPGYGTDYRYRSLKYFWGNFPQSSLTLDPFEWKILSSKNEKVVIESKIYKSIFYVNKIGKYSFYTTGIFNTDLDLIDIQLIDQLLGIISDEFSSLSNELNVALSGQERFKFQIIIAPSNYIKNNTKFSFWSHLVLDEKSLFQLDDIYQVSEGYFGLRITYNSELLAKKLQISTNRETEVEIIELIIKHLFAYFKITEKPEVQGKLQNLKTQKKRYGVFSIKKECSFPEHEGIIIPDETNFKYANKIIAELIFQKGIKEGIITKTNQESLVDLKIIREKIIDYIDNEIRKYGFNSSITFLIGKHDAIENDYFIKRERVKASLNHDNDYTNEELLNEYYKDYRLNINSYNFLIEKFCQHKPSGKKTAGKDSLKNLLAFISLFLEIQNISDIIHFQIHDATIEINADFLVRIVYPEGYDTRSKEYGEYLQRINLGFIGKNDDNNLMDGNLNEYLDNLDIVFEKDLGFTLKHLLGILDILSFWGKNSPENIYNEKHVEDIVAHILSEVTNINEIQVSLVLDFLTIDSKKLLMSVKGEGNPWELITNSDLPIWESQKRPFKYSLNPLIKKSDSYIWGSYSSFHTQKIWMGLAYYPKLPINLNLTNTQKFLESEHKKIEILLEERIFTICKKYSVFVKQGCILHKIDKEIEDIGDIDVLIYIPESNLLISIESKIIDSSYCLKDVKKEKEKIFGRHSISSGKFINGYLQKHEIRHVYLKKNYHKIMNHYKWEGTKNEISIVSLFVTRGASWIINNHPIDTEIEFMEIRLLDEYLLGVTRKNKN